MNIEDYMNGFWDFVASAQKVLRGGIEMYDVNGYYKYLTLHELFQYYQKTNPYEKQ